MPLFVTYVRYYNAMYINSGTQGKTKTEYEHTIWKIPPVWYYLFKASKVLSSFEKN